MENRSQQPPPGAGLSRRGLLGTLGSIVLHGSHAQPQGRTWSVGAGARLRTLGEALRGAVDCDTIELEPGRYPHDGGVAWQRRLTIRALGAGAVFDAEGFNAEGKAILVVRGAQVRVENCEFRGARVPDGNGAGIRFEQGRLQLNRCRFFDNEMGLLSANDPSLELEVQDCEFGAAPRHPGLLHHLLYVGAIGSFTLGGSRFGGGWRGHLVKTRARRNRIVANRIDDGADGEASCELEFPNGSDNLVMGNLIVRSARAQNPALVNMGAEARDGMGGSLLLAYNTLVNRGGDEALFVHLWTDRLRAPVPLRMVDNLFAGRGELDLPARADGGGNHRLQIDDLQGPDYRLGSDSPLVGSAVPTPPDETPQVQLRDPVGTRALAPGRAISPGAWQAS